MSEFELERKLARLKRKHNELGEAWRDRGSKIAILLDDMVACEAQIAALTQRAEQAEALVADLQKLEDGACKSWAAAEAEVKRLREALLLCRNELAWLFEQTGAKEGGSVWRAYTKADALLSPPPQEGK